VRVFKVRVRVRIRVRVRVRVMDRVRVRLRVRVSVSLLCFAVNRGIHCYYYDLLLIGVVFVSLL